MEGAGVNQHPSLDVRIGNRIRYEVLELGVWLDHRIHEGLPAVVALAVCIDHNDQGIRQRVAVPNQIAEELLELAVHPGQAPAGAKEPPMDADLTLHIEALQQRPDEFLMERILAKEGEVSHRSHP